jgi:uncharacterized protein (UPF0147 family)
MSSATVPHIFNEIINDSNIPAGTKIVAMAFWTRSYGHRITGKNISIV